MSQDLPAETRDFINQHISSVEELEVLLFLQQHAEASWTAKNLSEHFQSSLGSIEKRLEELISKKFITKSLASPPTYLYHPASADIDHQIRLLAPLYVERRITIIQFIFTKPLSKVQDFADAFKLREDKKDG